jgi:uncharacterized RDD family membrane protein YckC
MEPFETRSFSDQLNIATPEQVELQFPVAGIGSRFLAALIDHLLIAAGYVLIGILFVVVVLSSHSLQSSLDGETTTTAQKWFIALLILFVFCLQWGYFVFFEALRHGQTPGKRLMKLRVIKDSGRQITVFEALARNVLRVIDYLPSMYLVGVVTMLCNRKNKRLGDFVAGTVVVHERVDEQPLLYRSTTLVAPEAIHLQPWSTPPAGASAIFAADAIARLDANDLRVMETFFARALDLPMETRMEMAWRIAQQMTTKMRVPLPEGNPERLIEAMAHAMRGGGARF